MQASRKSIQAEDIRGPTMAEDRLAGEPESGEAIEGGYVLDSWDVLTEAEGNGGGGGRTEEANGAPEEEGPSSEEPTNDDKETLEGDFLPVDDEMIERGGSSEESADDEETSEGELFPADEPISCGGSNDEATKEKDAPIVDEEPASNESDRDDDDDDNVGRRTNSKQYELLPGLPVVLTDDADVTAATLGITGYEGFLPRHFFVSSTRIGLGRGSSFLGPDENDDGNNIAAGTGSARNFCAVVGYDVRMNATIERRRAAAVSGNEGPLVVRGLDVAIGGASIDPLADAGHVLAFLREFAGAAWDEPVRVGRRVELSLPPGPLGVEIRRSSGDGSCVVRARVDGSASPLRAGDVIESMNGMALAEVEGGLKAWARLFKVLADGERTVVVRRNLPDRRMTLEDWEQFLSNVKSDRRVSRQTNGITEDDCDDGDGGEYGNKSPPPEAFSPKAEVDILIPNARVGAFSLSLPDHKEPIEFPACEGTAECTLRTMLEYYCTAILRTIRERSRTNGKGGGESVADMASVKGSIVGATVGGVLLGNVGFLAGSYLGGKLGRKHSTVVGATAGACLFGPVGLIAGAAAAAAESGASQESSYSDADTSFQSVGGVAASSKEFGASGRPVRSANKSVAAHLSNNKLEYAGTTGVVAGAAVGAIAGPVGMLAGAYAGSVAARRGTKLASDSAAETRQFDGRSEYQFGDITRGLVARGKKTRGADRNDKYKFGDFTRGLFAGWE